MTKLPVGSITFGKIEKSERSRLDSMGALRPKQGLGDIVVLRGQAMRDLIEHLQAAEGGGAYELRFAIDDGGLKVKINNLTWSVPLGTVER